MFDLFETSAVGLSRTKGREGRAVGAGDFSSSAFATIV